MASARIAQFEYRVIANDKRFLINMSECKMPDREPRAYAAHHQIDQTAYPPQHIAEVPARASSNAANRGECLNRGHRYARGLCIDEEMGIWLGSALTSAVGERASDQRVSARLRSSFANARSIARVIPMGRMSKAPRAAWFSTTLGFRTLSIRDRPMAA